MLHRQCLQILPISAALQLSGFSIASGSNHFHGWYQAQLCDCLSYCLQWKACTEHFGDAGVLLIHAFLMALVNGMSSGSFHRKNPEKTYNSLNVYSSVPTPLSFLSLSLSSAMAPRHFIFINKGQHSLCAS